jgi:hypothetical protein
LIKSASSGRRLTTESVQKVNKIFPIKEITEEDHIDNDRLLDLKRISDRKFTEEQVNEKENNYMHHSKVYNNNSSSRNNILKNDSSRNEAPLRDILN